MIQQQQHNVVSPSSSSSASGSGRPRRTGRLRYAVLALALVTVAACGDGLGGWLVSDADEAEIGLGVDQTIEQDYNIVVDDDPVAVWARQLVGPLDAASQRFRSSAGFGGYKVEVIADDELINAFAAPGGYTYISTGLILQARNCASIAGVMGHELGHVTERHGVQNLESQFGAALLTQLVLGEGLASDIIQGVHSFLLSTTYSRDKETESDIVGLQLAYEAGYNPYGLVDFFEQLMELRGGVETPKFLSSHPSDAERIATITSEIQNRYGNAVVRGQTQSYECVNTDLSLAQVQERIRSGNLRVR